MILPVKRRTTIKTFLDESDPMEESSDFDKRTALRVSEGAD
jgi:hypothetical protein